MSLSVPGRGVEATVQTRRAILQANLKRAVCRLRGWCCGRLRTQGFLV